MSRRQAENLAKGNPAIAKRLKDGEFDNAPAGGNGGGKPPAKRKTVRVSAPPADPKTRSGGSRAAPPKTRTRTPREPRDDPPRDGIIRSVLKGIFDI